MSAPSEGSGPRHVQMQGVEDNLLTRQVRAVGYAFLFVVSLVVSLEVASTSGEYADIGFRQSQTAITSYYVIKNGFRLAYETPVLGAPWSIPLSSRSTSGWPQRSQWPVASPWDGLDAS